jgi:hypothetical protein
MLAETVKHLKAMPRDVIQRADAFEAFAGQIEKHWRGAWQAVRGSGADGSEIFLGRFGEGFVIAPDGGLYRGGVGRGIDITAAGVYPDYGAMSRLD